MSKRTFHDWREWRRFRAVQLLRRGWKQADIADALGVSEAAVSHWLRRLMEGGRKALVSRPHAGHGKLTVDQWGLIPDCLWHGAEAYGFRGDVWTCARVAKVLAKEFGVTYHKHHVARMLKDLGWTPQLPITRAIQRNEKAIEQWRNQDWIRLRERTHRERRTLVLTDESGFYLLPGVVRTYGPKGETPVLKHWATRDHLSVMGAVTPDGRVYSLIRQESFNGLHCVTFLKHLLRQVAGNLLVLWDRSPIHRRRAVKDYVSSVGEKRLILEPLPAYAPDLNPVEWLWKHLKKVELRNQACLDLEELHAKLHLALDRVRQHSGLIQSFFAGAGLNL